MDYTIQTLAMALIGGTLGMFSHIIKKKVKGESATAIMRYFSKHVGYTMTAFISMLGAVFAIYDPTMNIFKLFGACLSAGYMCDSVMNKDPK
jgi:hypothetical protein